MRNRGVPDGGVSHARRVRRAAVTVAVIAAVVAAVAAPASADSLVFLRGSNVWLANADGSGEYQVTMDGSSSAPYESPSQADDGTIVAGRKEADGKRRLYRMRQNGALLNPPFATPAPGTGALDPKVSPDGKLVAYWYATQVRDYFCYFCTSLTGTVLYSNADRFTPQDEIPGARTGDGEVPAWVDNDTVVFSGGSAAQWYHRRGMAEGAVWFGDSPPGNNPDDWRTIYDSEISRDGTRVALVRGNKLETIQLLTANGPPPAKPTAGCAFGGAVGSGQFHGPTWSQDGRTLAWQEDDGIWMAPIPDVTSCGPTAPGRLVIPGGSSPDFGPAVVNPGPREGGAAPAPGPTPTGPSEVSRRLRALLGRVGTALRALPLGSLVRAGRMRATFNAPVAGRLEVTLKAAGATRVLARGRVVFDRTGSRPFALRLTRAGVMSLRRSRRVRAVVEARFAPAGGAAETARATVVLRR